MAATEPSPGSGLEVDGLMRVVSRDGKAGNPIADRKPALERHISHIPQSDDDEADEDEDEDDEGDGAFGDEGSTHPPSTSEKPPRSGIKSKLRKLQRKVTGSGGTIEEDDRAAEADRQPTTVTSGTTLEDGSSQERSNPMDEETTKNPDILSPPRFARQPSSSPGKMASPQNPSRMTRLQRTISQVPQDDYDSDN